jgi:Ca2+/Na+ antiporter
MYSFMGISLVT